MRTFSSDFNLQFLRERILLFSSWHESTLIVALALVPIGAYNIFFPIPDSNIK